MVPPTVVALPTLGMDQVNGPLKLGMETSAIFLPVLQRSVPLIERMSVTTGEVPSEPQSRVMGSPALYAPPAGRAQVMLALTVERKPRAIPRRRVVVGYGRTRHSLELAGDEGSASGLHPGRDADRMDFIIITAGLV